MDYTCYKCGSSIQQGTPFCPQCGAPQIRVSSPSETLEELPAPAETPAFVPDTPAEMQPPAEPVQLAPTPPHEPQPDPDKIRWRDARSAILVGGLVAGLGPMLAHALLWTLAAITGGGAIAVGMYHRRHITTIAGNMGAKIGTAAAACGYAIFSILAVIAFVSSHELRDEIVKKIQEMPAQARDPQTAQTMKEIAAKMTTPEGVALMFTFMLAIVVVMFLGFGAIGGVIGASLTRRNQNPQ